MKSTIFRDATFTHTSNERTASVFRVKDYAKQAILSSETSVNVYQTIRRRVPEDSILHSHLRYNISPHKTLTKLSVKPGMDIPYIIVAKKTS
jgi:hypothetical protein